MATTKIQINPIFVEESHDQLMGPPPSASSIACSSSPIRNPPS